MTLRWFCRIQHISSTWPTPMSKLDFSPLSAFYISKVTSQIYSEKREKAYQCFADDLKRCEQLGLTLCNFQCVIVPLDAERI